MKEVDQVHGIAGVLSDGIRVSHSGVSDKQVERSVKQVSKTTTDIDDATMAIKVKNGTVVVSGTVADRRE